MTWKPDICVYHGGCADGFGAAWAVWKRWGDEVQYVPAVYGQPIMWPDNLRRKHILFVDFSLKRDKMIELAHWPAGVPETITVLDHHKTAEAELADWSGHMPLPENIPLLANKACCETGVPIVAVFDMNKSGACLAWEFCFPTYLPPTLLQYIQDRDLWRFWLDRTREVFAGLQSYPHDFETWDRLALDVESLASEGRVIERSYRKTMLSMCEQYYPQEIAGIQVPVVNVPYHYASDAAHELLQRHPEAAFAAAWFRRRDGKRQYSLRSEDHRTDVSEIAKIFGGGGHRNAAGFEIEDTAFDFKR